VTVVRSEDGLLWEVQPGTDDRLGPDMHERPLFHIAEAFCPPGGHFIDIGAHVGTWSVRQARRGCLVTAIEANTRTVATLEMNARLNGVRDRITIAPVAAWDSHKILSLKDVNGLSSGGSTRIVERSANPAARALAVPANTIMPPLTLKDKVFMKIDTEGAEARILRNLRTERWLATFKPAMLVELHGRAYNDPRLTEDALEELRLAGYTVGEPILYGDCDYVVAYPPSPVASSIPSSNVQGD
jgi:FkbM family methyltransferase